MIWPGADKDRAAGACFHLYMAALRLHAVRHAPTEHPWQITRRARIRSAGEHLRIARSYLNAIGFECR